MHVSSSARLTLALLAGGLAGTLPSQAAPDPVTGTSSAVFINPVQEAGSAPFLTGVGTNDIKWGDNTGTGTAKNELGFSTGSFNTLTDTPFVVGRLSYFNGTSATGTNIDGIALMPTLVFTAPAGIGTQSFTFEVPITATPNTGTQAQNADYITLATSFPNQAFTLGGKVYTLALTGFGNVNASNGFLANNNTELHVLEGASGSADLFGKVTLAPSTVPEPSQTLALAIGALGLAGLTLSRSRKKAAAAA